MAKAQPKKRPPRRATEVKDLSVKEKERSNAHAHARRLGRMLETGGHRRGSGTVWKDTECVSRISVSEIFPNPPALKANAKL
jgi:hypothetical protein